MAKLGRILTGLTAAAAILAGISGAAQAQTPTKLNQFQYWGAFSYKAGGKTVCYILSAPIKKEPASVNHGDNYFLVSKRGAGKLAFEPQFMAGYELKAQSHVVASVGAKSFNMFTKGNSAWVEGDAQEAQLLAAMRGGNTMEIKAVSKRGTNTSYSYSLKGLSAALKSIDKCK